MCIDLREKGIRTATRDRVVWKAVKLDVKTGVYKSRYALNGRTTSFRESKPLFHFGKICIYKLGETHRSPFSRSLGLFCYSKRDAAERHMYSDTAVLRCIIPRGTKYFISYGEIVTEELRIMKEVKP